MNYTRVFRWKIQFRFKTAFFFQLMEPHLFTCRPWILYLWATHKCGKFCAVLGLKISIVGRLLWEQSNNRYLSWCATIFLELMLKTMYSNLLGKFISRTKEFCFLSKCSLHLHQKLTFFVTIVLQCSTIITERTTVHRFIARFNWLITTWNNLN